MAITYGMSVQDFWEGDPDLFWAYRFAYFERLKQEQEIFNNNAWLQGAYFCEAVSVALNNAFSETKIDYSKKPYEITKEENIEDVKERQLEMQVAEIKARIAQVNAIKKSSTTKTKGEGGEKING